MREKHKLHVSTFASNPISLPVVSDQVSWVRGPHNQVLHVPPCQVFTVKTKK